MVGLNTFRQLTTLSILLFVGQVCASEETILHVVSEPYDTNADIVLDTRPLANCKESSLKGTVCLPIEDFVAPGRRLANWSGILWLLGTAGLSGKEHVLVVGDKPRRRHVLAGLLAIAGQKKISVLEDPVSTHLESETNVAVGTQRSTTRTKVFTEPMRSTLLVLRNELTNVIHNNVVLLDGRSEAEYFGTTIRAHRGGHIPGATHSPFAQWYKTKGGQIVDTHFPISYAHNSIDGLAYFSVLLSAGQASRLYLEGWVDWASNTELPIDSASYPQSTAEQQVSIKSKAEESNQLFATQVNLFSMLLGALITCCVITMSYFSVKGFRGRKV